MKIIYRLTPLEFDNFSRIMHKCNGLVCSMDFYIWYDIDKGKFMYKRYDNCLVSESAYQNIITLYSWFVNGGAYLSVDDGMSVRFI